MTIPLFDLAPNISAAVKINGADLRPLHQRQLVRTVVDTHLHLPDMFELKFEDTDNAIVAELGLRIGSDVEIVGSASSAEDVCLIRGEVTSIEGEYEGTVIHTIVRGYERSHRLQRATRTRTFIDMTDSDIAAQIAREAGCRDADITATRASHRHVSQINQTDWEFLRFRAQEIGFEVGVAKGRFFFRRASSAQRGEGGGDGLEALRTAIVDAVAGTGPLVFTFQGNLQWFRPRRSASGIPAEVEVRVYDYEAADVVVGRASVTTGTAALDCAVDPMTIGAPFAGGTLPVPTIPNIPGMPSLGSAPSSDARVVNDRPLDWGTATSRSVDEVAKGVAEHIGSTVLEAEGMAYGDPRCQAGAAVTIDGVAEEFAGLWMVTAAHHVFSPEDGGYTTRFEVSGRHDRSLLGLTTLGQSSARAPRLNGAVIAIVTNNNDPDQLGRVKLGFPWLAPSYESDWARVVHPGLGSAWGTLLVPEVGDEVLVAFEFGDARRPYVLGGLVNGNNKHPLLGDAVKAAGSSAQVVKRGFVSRVGNQLTFEDEIPSPLAPSPPTTGTITLGDADGKLQVVLDVVGGELRIVCDGGVSIPTGTITIEQTSSGGSIVVRSAGDVTVEATGSGKLALKGAAGVSIDGGNGKVEVNGNGGVSVAGGAGTVEISGSLVKLN